MCFYKNFSFLFYQLLDSVFESGCLSYGRPSNFHCSTFYKELRETIFNMLKQNNETHLLKAVFEHGGGGGGCWTFRKYLPDLPTPLQTPPNTSSHVVLHEFDRAPYKSNITWSLKTDIFPLNIIFDFGCNFLFFRAFNFDILFLLFFLGQMVIFFNFCFFHFFFIFCFDAYFIALCSRFGICFTKMLQFNIVT